MKPKPKPPLEYRQINTYTKVAKENTVFNIQLSLIRSYDEFDRGLKQNEKIQEPKCGSQNKGFGEMKVYCTKVVLVGGRRVARVQNSL